MKYKVYDYRLLLICQERGAYPKKESSLKEANESKANTTKSKAMNKSYKCKNETHTLDSRKRKQF